MTTTPLACSNHNHTHCISDALGAARTLCDDRGVRLTPLRQQVLELIWQNHKPLGAYLLMDMLATASTRRVAPPTVYRALDFLLEQGLIHRINGLNAFIGCPSPGKKHQSHFLICRVCGVAVEMNTSAVTLNIQLAAREAGFSVESHSVEVMGVCPSCSTSEGRVSLPSGKSNHE
jgi:Fur family zinc uptake transcriptional regulator